MCRPTREVPVATLLHLVSSFHSPLYYGGVGWGAALVHMLERRKRKVASSDRLRTRLARLLPECVLHSVKSLLLLLVDAYFVSFRSISTP